MAVPARVAYHGMVVIDTMHHGIHKPPNNPAICPALKVIAHFFRESAGSFLFFVFVDRTVSVVHCAIMKEFSLFIEGEYHGMNTNVHARTSNMYAGLEMPLV